MAPEVTELSTCLLLLFAFLITPHTANLIMQKPCLPSTAQKWRDHGEIGAGVWAIGKAAGSLTRDWGFLGNRDFKVSLIFVNWK